MQVYRDASGPIKLGFTRSVAPGLWLKLKRREAIALCWATATPPANLNSPLEPSPPPPPTACEVNKRTFQWALETAVSPHARQRYLSEGKQLVFVEDKELTWGPGWLAAPLEVRPLPDDPTTVTVRSPVLYTSLDALPERFAGMCYFKCLSRAQAVEWILHDAFVTVPTRTRTY